MDSPDNLLRGKRGEIVDYLSKVGSAYFSEIKEALKLNNGALLYQLDILEKKLRLVDSHRDGQKHFYSLKRNGLKDNFTTEEHILDVLSRNEEGLKRSQLSHILGIRETVLCTRLCKLVADGRIKKDDLYYYLSSPGRKTDNQ